MLITGWLFGWLRNDYGLTTSWLRADFGLIDNEWQADYGIFDNYWLPINYGLTVGWSQVIMGWTRWIWVDYGMIMHYQGLTTSWLRVDVTVRKVLGQTRFRSHTLSMTSRDKNKGKGPVRRRYSHFSFFPSNVRVNFASSSCKGRLDDDLKKRRRRPKKRRGSVDWTRRN